MTRARCDTCQVTLLRANAERPCGGCGGPLRLVRGVSMLGVPPRFGTEPDVTLYVWTGKR